MNDFFHRIGVIADTHDRWLPRVAELFAEVDEIWHLGDLCHDRSIDELHAMGKPFLIVLGNNDSPLTGLPLTRQIERHGETFHLVHIPPRKIEVDSNWLLHGHTHVPRDEVINGVHVFNPGSAGRANKGAPLSVGFLTKQGSKPYQAEVCLLQT